MSVIVNNFYDENYVNYQRGEKSFLSLLYSPNLNKHVLEVAREFDSSSEINANFRKNNQIKP